MPICRTIFFTTQPLSTNSIKALKSYGSKDVNEWFSSVLDVNSVNIVQLSNEILNHISQVQAIGQKYTTRRSKVNNVQSVWISF